MQRSLFRSRRGRQTVSIVGFALLALLGLSNFAIGVQAGDGDLDPTFNGTGRVTTPVGGFEDRANAVALQPDGKIVVVGHSNNGLPPQFHNDFTVVRYNPDGSLDTSFDSDGKVTTSVGSSDDDATGVAIQTDGRIVVAGFSHNGRDNDFAVVRYNSDGSLDTSFDEDGKVTTPVGSSSITPDDRAHAVAIQTDGKIVVAGSARNSGDDFAVVRYNTNGSLDASFGPGGKVTTAVGASTADDQAYAVAIQTDSKIVAVGSGGGSFGDFAVVRYNTNGSLDTSFGPSGTGIVTTEIGNNFDSGRAVSIQTDGKIVAVGYFLNALFDHDFAVLRYNANGSLDASFGSGGKVTTSISDGSDIATAVVIQTDGKIVAVGHEDLSNGNFEVVRYNTNGSLDTSFDSDGKVVTSIGSRDVANAVVVQPDGKIVAAGYAFVSGTGDDFAVVRYNGSGATLHFSAASYSILEDCTSLTITITRVGDTTGEATVNYATTNGTASDRADFTCATGTLRFGAGEAQQTFTVLITEDSRSEGTETATITLSNPTGASLGTPSVATIEIFDDPSEPAGNAIDDAETFACQHYHDFLNRQPDAAGLQFWTNEIISCGASPQCIDLKRINVSAAFFLSIEFQETGYLVYRMYKAAFGDTDSPNVAIPVPIIRLSEFLPDAQRIGQGVQVGIGDWQGQLEANKNAYAREFVIRQRFFIAYPLTMTAAQFVDQLNLNAGSVLSPAERNQLIAQLAAAPDLALGRATVLREVAEDADLRQRETNRAFVLMQYYGYLRRNPDDPQDSDFRGWEFWLNKLNQFNGNFVQAEMVKAFISSIEYRQRFGP